MADTQTITVGGDIPVTAEPGLDINVAVTSKVFTDWLASVDRTQFNLRGIHIQSVDMFGPTRVGFLKFKVDHVDAEGKALPGVIFARGGSVAMLPAFVCNGKTYVVLTVQPRLATGKFFIEVPAGMLDGSGHFAGVAAKELKEELGVVVSTEDLTDLSALAGYPEGVFLSPGACEETIRIFGFIQDVTQAELDDMNGRVTGAAEENEQITLKIVELNELLGINDAKTLVAYTLFNTFRDKVKTITTAAATQA